MADKKPDWGDIPSLGGLSVDWEYEPENPLGKRQVVRLTSVELRDLIGNKAIPVKVVAKGFEETGRLLDISSGGVAVLLKSELVEGKPVKLGMFLGKEKIISRALVRSSTTKDDGFRTGLEFVELPAPNVEYISSLISSRVYKSGF